MPTVEQLRQRLLEKLRELFQLNQPDLDFGFYRIMHAKAKQVGTFIDRDLLRIVGDAFAQADPARLATLRAECEKAVQAALEYGAADPEETEPVRRARAALAAAADNAAAEAEVYDHLFRFFERYYDDGDFVSRRYVSRETPGRAAPFAVPYNGEEVKLHWANADQYYIKTAEHFASFTFDLRQTPEVRKIAAEDVLGLGAHGTGPLKVHCRIVDATEGEHGNVKASDANRRYFIVHRADPVGLTPEGELEIRFEYRPDPEKTGQDGTWREKRNAETVATVLAALAELAAARPEAREYARLLALPAPTEKDRERPLLARYVNHYTARNTMDYFIHKDLGGFLRRELDFYIKNEVMHLDDIENAEVPAVESYLAKIRVLRRIAGRLIDFLAQLEDFQKKLWLKRKFVVETNWCITLDRIPESFYSEIAASDAQREEWVRLFAIDEIKAGKSDLFTAAAPTYTVPLTTAFLKANDKLVLDTAFFQAEFRDRLLAAVEDLDERTDGLLFHSENTQALSLLTARYYQSVKFVYTDPPYNTNEATFIYKNGYKHSSWLDMVGVAAGSAVSLLLADGVFCSAIDDLEQAHLVELLDLVFGADKRLGILVVEIKPSGRTNDNFFATSHEYLLFYGLDPKGTEIAFFGLTEEQVAQYGQADEESAFKWRDFLRTGGYSTPEERPNSYYPIYYREKSGRISLEQFEGATTVLPIDSEGKRRVWRKTPPSFVAHLAKQEIQVVRGREGGYKVQIIDRIKTGTRPKSVWTGKRYDAASHGTKLLKAILGNKDLFSFPKSFYAVRDCAYVALGDSESGLVLDYFAGSGTTGHAVIDLNREDGGNRKYILVEMGDYFDTVLKPRIQKVVYSADWKDGKPVSRDTGVSHCFKYLRLESYEDTLNNLRFADDPRRDEALAENEALREDYLLHYLLDVETRGSQSLLNIDAFADPEAYCLRVKKPGSDESVFRPVDLAETFHYLIGLRVVHQGVWQGFAADFRREPDPELPEDQHTRLALDGRLRQDADGPWRFRRIEGWVPANPREPNNGQREKVLVVWRKLTGNPEQDNAVLDEWFRKNCISTQDFEFDTIYVNGSNNLPNLRRAGDTWKVRLLEEEFMKRMWSGEEA